MDFVLKTRLEAPCPVVRCIGEIDVASGPRLLEEVELLARAGFRRIVVDLSRVTFLDSAGIGCLIAAIGRVGEHGTVALAQPQPRVARVLALTGLTEHIQVHDTVDLAQLGACGSDA